MSPCYSCGVCIIALLIVGPVVLILGGIYTVLVSVSWWLAVPFALLVLAWTAWLGRLLRDVVVEARRRDAPIERAPR